MQMFPEMDYSKLGMILNSLSLEQSATRGVTLEKSVVSSLQPEESLLKNQL